jgi:hypothetical protein
MSSKRKKQAKSMVMIPLYRMRVVEDKTMYKRKEKHRSSGICDSKNIKISNKKSSTNSF